MEELKQFFTENDKFAEYVGIELLEASEGKAKAKMEIKEHHLNAIKTVHGAAIFTSYLLPPASIQWRSLSNG